MKRNIHGSVERVAALPAGFFARSPSSPSRFGMAFMALLAGALPFSAWAYEISDAFSLDGTLTGVLQHGQFSGAAVDDTGRAALVTDIEASFRPTDRDEFNLLASFAVGDALNTASPYSAHPLYADDLEEDLEDINGRGRDYLLTAWYKHTFTLAENTSFALTGGIIDAGDYVDDNAFANDEVSQFMNEAFVNNTLMVPPSFEGGIAGELELGGRWSARGVWMNGRNVDADNNLNENYNYFAGQLGLHTGSGNYRLLIQGTSRDFAAPTGGKEGLFSVGLSLDQQLNDTVGAFARLAWQDDEATVSHDALYSGGLNIQGKLWGRAGDEAGLAYARLDGGNGDVEKTDAVEGYVKFQLGKYADFSLDVQYLNEETTGTNDPSGFVYGARINGYF